jgi:hypothetical protein
MAVSVKAIKLWRSEITNQPGALAEVLAPLAQAGADLQILMGYRYPDKGNETRAAVEVFPITGRRSIAAAQSAGLRASAQPALLVEGDNRQGAGSAISQPIADAGINLNFIVAQVIGRRFSAVFGFDTDDDARKAATLIKKAMATKKSSKKK